MSKHKYNTWLKYAKLIDIPVSLQYEQFISKLPEMDFQVMQTFHVDFYRGRYSCVCDFDIYVDNVKQYIKSQYQKRGSPYDIDYIMKRDSITKEEAEKKVNEYKDKTKGTLDVFILRHGEEEGKKRFNEFCVKSKSTIENYKIRYGENWKEKWDHFMNTRDTNSIEFFMKKGYALDEAQSLRNELANKKSVTLEKCIERYGETDGRKKWEQICNAKRIGKDFYVNKYGEEQGSQIWDEICKKKRMNLDQYIMKYGDELGRQKHKENSMRIQMIFKELEKLHGTEEAIRIYSTMDKKSIKKEYGIHIRGKPENLTRSPMQKIQIKFFSLLEEKLGRKLEYSRKSEKRVFDEVHNTMYMYDCYDPKTNTLIEFHGKAFHPKEGDYGWVNPFGQTYDEIFTRDNNKKNTALLNGFNYIVVWDHEVKNKTITEKTIDRLVKELS